MIVQLSSVEDLKVLSGKTFKEIEEVEAIDFKNVRKVPFDFSDIQMTEEQRLKHVKACMEILSNPKTWKLETYKIKTLGEMGKSKKRKKKAKKNK